MTAPASPVPPPRYPLALLPTPLVRAPRLEAALGSGPIWIKRDDLTGFGVSGNKARPLEILIADALAAGADVLVATGAPSSNFCAAAAAAARVAGLGCELLYAGDEPSPAPFPVALARAAGAHLRFDAALARDELDIAVQKHAAQLEARGARPYAVPRGGATAIGAVGFAHAAGELASQCAEHGIDRGVLVVAHGSGATQAGLVAGRAAAGLGLHIVGASVSRPVEQARRHVLTLARDCARLLGYPEPEEADVDVRDVIGPGFGVASPRDRASSDLAYAAEGLLLDDTYTAKAMTLLRDLADSGRGADQPLVFWHTGGVTGALTALTHSASRPMEST